MRFRGNLRRWFILPFLLCCIGNAAYATDKEREGETLWGIEFSKKFKKSLELSIGEELRTRSFIQEVNRLSTNVAMTYNHPDLKALKGGIDYNFLNYFEHNRIEENRHRLSVYLQYKYSYAGVDFSLRTRMQTTFRDESRGSYAVNPKYVWRNRIRIAYPIYRTPYEPYFQFEVNNPVANPKGNRVNRLRYRAGCEYRINKHNAIDLFFRCTQEINQADDITLFGVGVGYNFKH